ncbi:hypothetical protein TURU_137847 [Turdus rufiventris]|nr:hypothetical protein TURU_137847 [Turdus rufiventris]
MCLASAEGVKCKCSRKGPKIRFSNVRKLEIKPRYPFCVEEMIIVTLWTRVRGEQQHCLNPKRQNTVRLLKWYRVWKEKGRFQVVKPQETLQSSLPHTQTIHFCSEIENEAAAVWSEHTPASHDCSPVINLPSQEPERLQDLSLLQPHQENQTSPELFSSFPGPAIPSQAPLLPSKNQFAKCYLSISKSNVVVRKLGKGQAGSVAQQHDRTRRVWPFSLENLD